jgi:MYXO-CTERM domain-containing protein
MAKSKTLHWGGRAITRAVATAFALPLALQVSACSDAPSASHSPSASPDPAAPVTLRGELRTYVATLENGTSERYYVLRTDDGVLHPLLFDDRPALAPWSTMTVWGAEAAGGIRVARYETSNPVEVPTKALTMAPTPKTMTFAFVMVDVGGGVTLTAAQAQQVMFGTNPTDKSFKQFYEQSSYGALTITGDVVGPFTYSMLGACSSGNGGGPDALAAALQTQIPKTYDHYVYYFGSKVAACSWTGLAQEGSASRPSQNTWINNSTGCVVLAQEPGHNIGLMHASTIRCTGASFANDPLTCVDNEYGNPFTPMGRGCHDLNMYEKWYEGWLSGCNGVKVTSSGVFTLLPIETGPCQGIQALQIPMPVATRTIMDPQRMSAVPLKNYYVELREPLGIFDSTLNPSTSVLVYAADDLHPPAKKSIWSYLLDMDPTTPTTFDGLKVGQTFADPAGGVSITLMAVDANKATVKVDIQATGGAAPTCIDGTTLAPPGPDNCGAGVVLTDGGLSGSSSASSSGSGSGSSSGAGPGSSGSSSGGSSSGLGGSGSGSSSGSSTGVGGGSDDGGNGTLGAEGGLMKSDASLWGSGAASTDWPPPASVGCGCHVVDHSSEGTRPWAVIAALALLGRARRRR